MSEIQKFSSAAPRGKIRLVPGDIVYAKLIKTNPKKLQRLIKDEQAYFQQTHAPGWEEEFHTSVERGRAENDRINKKSVDYQLLGLDQEEERVTKRIVRNAYRRAARKLHPDAGGSDEAFKQLHNAYRRVLAAVPSD